MKARSRSSEGERGGCVSGASAQPLLLTEAKGSSSTLGHNSDRTGLPEEQLTDNRLSPHPALPPHTAERRAGRSPVQLCTRQVQLRGGAENRTRTQLSRELQPRKHEPAPRSRCGSTGGDHCSLPGRLAEHGGSA